MRIIRAAHLATCHGKYVTQIKEIHCTYVEQYTLRAKTCNVLRIPKISKIQFTYKKNTCDLHNTLYQLQNTSKNTLHPQNTSKSKLYQQTLSKIQFTYPKYTVQTPGCDTQN